MAFLGLMMIYDDGRNFSAPHLPIPKLSLTLPNDNVLIRAFMIEKTDKNTGDKRIILDNDEIRMGFLAQCVEAVAEADRSDYLAMLSRLEAADMTQGYILRFYDTLHTESVENITQSLLKLLLEREARIKR